MHRRNSRPTLGDFAVRDPPHHEPMKLDTLTGFCVRSGPKIADHNLIALGHVVKHLHPQVRKHLVHIRHHGAVVIPSGWLSAGSIMVQKILGDITVDRRQVPLVHEFFKMPDDQPRIVIRTRLSRYARRHLFLRSRNDMAHVREISSHAPWPGG
jgi:hypothetical protein